MELRVDPGVYEPAEDSQMILGAAMDYRPRSALELGTGCGLAAIALSKTGCQFVLATDVSIEAIRCAGNNARKYAPRLHLLLCDLFGGIDRRFDLVLFNPPYLPVEATAGEEVYWAGGPRGRLLIDRFICSVDHYLSEDGRALLLQSSLNELELSHQLAAEKGLQSTLISSRKFFFEELHVLELRQVG